jgi:hypothetical protein
MLLRNEYFNFFNSRPIVFGDARRLHGGGWSTPSDGSGPGSSAARGTEAVVAAAAVFEADWTGAESAVSELGVVGSSGVASALAGAAVPEPGVVGSGACQLLRALVRAKKRQ